MSGRITKFEQLDVWKISRELSRGVYELTLDEQFSKDYRFVSQIRSSSGSVMENIAEGFCRDGTREFIQFLSIAKGSCGEVQSQLYRAFDCKYIDETTHNDLYTKYEDLIGKLSRLMDYLRNSPYAGTKFQKK